MPYKKVRVKTRPRWPLGKVRTFFKNVFVENEKKTKTSYIKKFDVKFSLPSKLVTEVDKIMNKWWRSVTKTEQKYYDQLVSIDDDEAKAKKLYKKLTNLINSNNKNRAKRKK